MILLLLRHEVRGSGENRDDTSSDVENRADDPASSDRNVVWNIHVVRSKPSRDDDEHEDASDNEADDRDEVEQAREFHKRFDFKKREHNAAKDNDKTSKAEDPADEREGGRAVSDRERAEDLFRTAKDSNGAFNGKIGIGADDRRGSHHQDEGDKSEEQGTNSRIP